MEKDVIRFVQQRLWSSGHKIKRMPAGMDFDLIIDSKIRLKVVTGIKGEDVKNINRDNCDVVALVENEIDGSQSIFYINGSNISKRFKEVVKIK